MPFRGDLPKQEVYERLIDAFRLWCDDLQIWRGESIGLYAEEDPYPEVRWTRSTLKRDAAIKMG